MENYIRPRRKSELKKLYTNLKEKGITDSMMSDLIEACYNEKPNMRTSGFDIPADPDALMSFDPVTRIFTIAPFDPEVEGFSPRFGIYTWAEEAVYHRIFEAQTVEIPDAEGLYIVYFDIDSETLLPVLAYLVNPTEDQLKDIYFTRVIVASIYWDATNHTAIHVGDDRHGSEWPPQIHWYLHNAIGARRKAGLYFKDMIVNGDGSSNDHAKFSIAGGIMLHDDFEMVIPDSEIEIPILNFYTNNVPRFAYYTGFSVWKGNNRLCYNASQTHAVEAESGNFVIYHYFATNDLLPPNGDGINRKIISVMGTQEYTSLGAAYLNTEAELIAIGALMPQQGRCYIGSVIFQTADEYTNTIKARVVGLVGNEKSHPPVSIAAGSKTYLEIDEKQELKFLPAGIAPYNWKLHSPEQVTGYLAAPTGIAVYVDGIGAVIESVAVGQLKVTALNAQGETTPADIPAFDVLSDSTQAMISWTAVTGATAYRVYDTVSGNYKEITGVGFNYIGFVFDMLGDPPTENAAAVLQTPFTIASGDTVEITGDGLDVETRVDPLDATKKEIHLVVTPGLDGREVEISTSGGYIVWRYVGETVWNNLVALASLVGPTGLTGATGAPGDDGRGITSIVLHSTVGKVKTYRITFTDATTFDFEVTDGEDGTGGGGVTQITGLTVLATGWVADGTLYKYELSNAGILVTHIVEVVPDNTAYDLLVVAKPLQKTESVAGAVTMWMHAVPTADFTVTLNLYTKTA